MKASDRCIFLRDIIQASPPTVDVVEGVPIKASACGLVVEPILT